MSSMITALIAIAVFIVLLNGFAAGLVAVSYFWRDAQGVMKRALVGALGAGIVCLLMVSGPLVAGRGLGNGLAAAVLSLATIFAVGFLVSLPGAYILSRKIGDRKQVDPGVFS